MPRLLSAGLLLTLLAACATSTPVGPISVATLQQTAPAFARAETVRPDEVTALRTALAHKGPVELTVFFGDWCSDSQREIPRLLALLRELPAEQITLTLVNLPRAKEQRAALLGQVTVERVPTIIVSQNDQELGRIVEQAKTTLAGDWLALLQ